MTRSGEGANTDSVARLFDELAARAHEPLLEKAKGTFRFDLTSGKKVERWLVTINRGDVVVSRRNSAADCVIRCERAQFERILAGRTNAMAAMLRGEIELEGDLGLMATFQRLLPGPQRSSDARHAAGYARRQS
jgi:putative sterol carrier protein